MSMDIKDIIKWFIPCFHILLMQKLNKKWIVVCLFLFFNLVASSKINSDLVSNKLGKNVDGTKNFNVGSIEFDTSENSSQSVGFKEEVLQVEKPKMLGDTSVGRTFGRPFKKMMAGLIPVIFQIGAASTWAVVAALVGVKTLLVTLVILKVLLIAGAAKIGVFIWAVVVALVGVKTLLLVTLVILKLLLVAGAAKIGALFAGKGHQSHGWEPPHQKEIHLHIHNGGHEHHVEHEHHDEHLSSWSREGHSTVDPKPVYVYEPYRAGPQTISTPYGNYMKIDQSPLGPLGPVTVSTS